LKKAAAESDVGKPYFTSYGVDLSLSLGTQNHLLNALLVGIKAVGADVPLHARVVDTYLAEFVSQEKTALSGCFHVLILS